MLNNASQQPIGIFDSGIGGLTVTNAIVKHLPNEEIIYFGDTFHVPYGEKSPDAIRYYCLRIAKFLIEQGCKMIVVACNSAASVAYEVLTDFFKGQVLFINVVDPLVQRAVQMNYKRVGLIATKATIISKIYPQKLKALSSSMEVYDLATPLLAPMIEEGFVKNKVSNAVLENYLSDPRFENIEAILLACTHYPLVKKAIESFFDHRVEVLDSTDVVALAVRRALEENQLLNNKRINGHHFFVSDYTPSFEQTTRLFYGEAVNLQHYPLWPQ